MKPAAEIEACRTSQGRLLAGLASLTDEDFRSLSLLPGYSRAHLVTHLANKARAHAWIFGGPAASEVRQLHPAGYNPVRAAEAGAHRTASELCSDLLSSFLILESAWGELDEMHWESQAIMTAGPRSMAEIVTHHLRNVEVHHVDLDIGYQFADCLRTFVDGELAKRLRDLPNRADHSALLAWLLARAPAPDLGPW
ncbi:MAG: maleylpyruvate isomerase N-terminal domain-containing protein [Acidimicrobiia bacterium]